MLMLARNAESLYWIGRYVERADDTARILDVTVHQLLEDSSVDPDQASRMLLKVLGIEPPETALDVWSLTDFVAYSRNTDGGCSIVDAISAARENAEVGTRSHLHRDLGVPQHHLQRARRTRTRRQTPWPTRVPVVHRRPRGDVRRAGRLDASPRRRVPLHGAGPRDRAGRHDGAAAAVPGRRQRVVAGMGDAAALRGRARHLPAHLPRCAGRGPGGRVHVAGPTFPAVDLLLAEVGRTQPRRVAAAAAAAGSAPPPKRSACWAGRAANWNSCSPACCSSRWRSGWPACRKRAADVGEALALQYFHAAPWVAWYGCRPARLAVGRGG